MIGCRKAVAVPFTPFHLGIGAAAKATFGDRFSFMVFGGSQVIMDLEPGFKMLTGATSLHGPSHTMLGALGVGALAALTGKPISELVLRRLRFPGHEISWSASVFAAFLGTFSHIAFDAIMHADMHPWLPIGSGNALLGMLSMGALHGFCLAAGIIGAIGVWLRYRGGKPL